MRDADPDALALELRGFAQQSAVPLERIVDALERLPRFHLRGLREIEFDPHRFHQRASAYYLTPRTGAPLPNLRCSAEYLRGEDRILVYRCESLGAVAHVLYHEIGHHVFHRVIDGATRKEWVTRVYGLPGDVTPYATRNALEGFSEAYAAFALDLPALLAAPAKRAFLRERVFRKTGR